LYKIDALIQQLLISCKDEKKFEKVEFKYFKNEMKKMKSDIMSHSFNCHLPARYQSRDNDKMLTNEDIGDCKTNKKKKQDSNTKSENQNKNNNNNSNNNTNSNNNNKNNNNSNNNNNKKDQSNYVPLENKDINPEWKISQEFRVTDYIREHGKSNPAPKLRGNAFCVMLHGKGKCSNPKCGYEHTDPRSCGMAEQFTTYMKEMQKKA
jgi:hypothetical protein